MLGNLWLIPFQTDAEYSVLGSLTVASKQSGLTSVSSDEHLEVQMMDEHLDVQMMNTCTLCIGFFPSPTTKRHDYTLGSHLPRTKHRSGNS